jgi:hypothetical protein
LPFSLSCIIVKVWPLGIIDDYKIVYCPGGLAS